MDNAFLIGNAAIVRLLLKAKADLEYRNLRTWTAVYFLWDPDPNHIHPDVVGEILEICMAHDFSGWNEPDPDGWTPSHRAAAYGSFEDIQNLHCKGANLRCGTTDLLWNPMACAVWFGNDSTFDAFIELFSVDEILEIKDGRGWTLLHMAAKYGYKHMLRILLDLGADTGVLTFGTDRWVAQTLHFRRLTAETIAREYGHGAVWDDLMEGKD